VTVAAVLAAGALSAESPSAQKSAKPTAAPSHRVVACYFHRTVRCPTCRRISAYIEEGIQAGFAREIQEGRVSVAMVDFQDPKNERFTNFYKITGPTLVLMDIREGKVASWKPAPKVWSLVGDKEAFFRYVQGEVRAYLDGK
jgi:hypothetical protein